MEIVTRFTKLRHLMLTVVLTTMSLFVVSCGGSDDDDVPTVDATSVLASSYSGTLKPSCSTRSCLQPSPFGKSLSVPFLISFFL